MSLILYQYNQKAYEAVRKMLEKTGRAAVIHPTGTGKSFLGFKLAEENPESRILWLAPSAYIFRTQAENLKKAAGEEEAERILSGIRFMTYAGLMAEEQKGNGRIEEPDCIILDEFHRCGAAEWGKSVQRLLEAFPKAKLLGLSATGIRYLDGQRDMAEELFHGCTASEMTLGEAVGKGILPAPDYVVSMYAYEEAYRRLKKQVQNTRNPALKKENEKLLEELRRALEQADGLDEVFRKHMVPAGEGTEGGKYLVFCSGREHMEEMASHAGEWFRLVDRHPHCYKARYDNPETSREFSAFLEDKSSHLKLLYCIDMLNEGIHVEGIDGVILLRPTVSPTLYLQQIGRSLTAGKRSGGRRPVIFDIVNNFEGLYSYGALDAGSMEAFYGPAYKKREKDGILERFRIYDEVRDCRELFGRLNRNLSATWELYYLEAERYYREHGDLCIPNAYTTETGLAVGIWLQTQRRVHAGKIPGKLSREQEERLGAIGMDWEDGSGRKWKRGYRKLEEYRNRYGSADVKTDYVTEDGFALGKWVSNLRSRWKRGEVGKEEEASLNKLGMIWDKHESQWEKSYRAAEKYFAAYGNLKVPGNYRTEDGITLGLWVANQRRIHAGKKPGAAPLSETCIRKLDRIGMDW